MTSFVAPDHSANALLEVALQLCATRSLGDLLPVVLSRLVDLAGAERALFALFDERGAIEDAVLHGLSWERGTPLPISNRVVSEVLSSREMRQVVNTELDTELTLHESIQQHKLRAVLAVPVLACGRVAGVLYADSKAPVLAKTFQRSETLRALAGIVGIAVENVKLLEEQRLRTVLLGKLVHDLKSPLLAVVLGTEVVRESANDSDLCGVVDDVLAAGRRMQIYCDSALAFAGIESSIAEPMAQPTDMAELLGGHLRLFQRIAGEYNVTLTANIGEGLPHPDTWADRVGLTLDNLVLNAIKHAKVGSQVTLSARVRKDVGGETTQRPPSAMAALFRRVTHAVADGVSGFVEVSVHNQGRAIDAAMLPRIFDEWVRGDAVQEIASTGLGLAIVEQCVRSMGGRVWVQSTDTDGTTFSFTVPVARLK
jgi:signal transduction histidine kinase